MNGRSLFILALAVVIGLGAMILTQQMLSGGNRRKNDDTQEVLVAVRDFKEEEILKPDMVKVIRMAKSAVPANAFSSFKDVEDRWVKNIHAGRRCAGREKTGPQGNAAGLGRQHSPGMRAFAIDVTEQSGVSGFILPGHHVDVVRHETQRKERVSSRDDPARRARPGGRPGVHATRGTRGPVANGDPGAQARGRRHPGRGPSPRSSRRSRFAASTITTCGAPGRQAAIDPEHEKRLKLEEEKRLKLEEELRRA